MNELHSLIKSGKYTLKDEISQDAQSLIRGILETDPKKRMSLKAVLSHVWLSDAPESLEIFTETELNIIKREFTYNNVRRLNRNLIYQSNASHDTANGREFTEHPLDSTMNSDLRNVSSKSVILAPFNST